MLGAVLGGQGDAVLAADRRRAGRAGRGVGQGQARAGAHAGGFERALEPAGGGRARQALVAFGVGPAFGDEFVGGAGGEVSPVQLGGSGGLGRVGWGGDGAEGAGGVDQRLGEGGAVPAAFDLQGAVRAGLDAELVVAVVEDESVAQGAGGQLEGFGAGVVVGPVAGEVAGGVAAAADVGQDGDGVAPRGGAGPVQGEAEHQRGRQGRVAHPGAASSGSTCGLRAMARVAS